MDEFRKPRRPTTATPFVHIGGAGTALGTTEADVRRLLAPHGHVVRVVLPPAMGFCVAEMGSAPEAAAAVAALHNTSPLGPRRIRVVHAERKGEAADPDLLDPEAGPGAAGVPGLAVVPEWVTAAEEAALLARLDAGDRWDRGMRRPVQHFGFAFDYERRGVDPAAPLGPLPAWVAALAARAEADGFAAQALDQATANEYEPGVGITAHVDTHSAFEGEVLSLSLGSATVMEFRRGERRVAVRLPARSLAVLRGEARYGWEHGIAARRTDLVGGTRVARARRVSLTLRAVRARPCARGCRFPELCDSRQHAAACDVAAEGGAAGAGAVEAEHVHAVYDDIAEHFSHTRYAPWPRLEAFVRALPPGALVADVGCGNGKYARVRSDLAMVGVDRSARLLELSARARGPFAAAVGDVLRLPLRAAAFDVVLCVAVLHHLAAEERRLQALRELWRVVRPGGRILVHVWALEQPADSRRQFEQQDVFVPWHLDKRFAPPAGELATSHARRAGGRVTVQRYCHVYREGELEELWAATGLPVEVESVEYDAGNWTMVVVRGA